MSSFLVRRLLLMVLILFGVSLITFSLAYLIPGRICAFGHLLVQ